MQNLNNMRILIIDDNPAIHQDFLKILSVGDLPKHQRLQDKEQFLFGDKPKKFYYPEFIIDTASQGEEGVQCVAKAIIEDNPYALAFVDIRMPPGWDGIETIKHIWELDNDIQIVICTAFSDYSWEQTVEQLGQRDNLLILKKPFDHSAVRQLSMALTKKWNLSRKTFKKTQNLINNQTILEEKIIFETTHDTLTKLPNKRFLMAYIQQQITKSTQHKSQMAILYFNIDRFKLINDSFSHSVGDEVLKLIANRIGENIDNNIMVAKLGSDEFVLVVTDFKSNESLVKIARVLLNKFKLPFSVKGHAIIISPSIGISIFPANGKTIDELIQNATLALTHAKNLGGGQMQFYTKELNQENLYRLEMETALHHAIEKDEFYLCYQPQYDLITNKLVSAEALIRWRHPINGIMLPIDFIPIIEEIGLMTALSEKVLKLACSQNKKWQDQGLPPIRVAVNLTAQEFKQPTFVEIIKHILKEAELQPIYLEIELTEKIIIKSIESINKISKLRELGISVAIDDFGTGYSSLNYLSEIPVNRLKIDQSFIQKIGFNTKDDAIVQAIITLAKDLNLIVLAEGVETKQQLDFLKSKKCDEAQGYYFNKPLEADQFEELLRNCKE